ncbi:MAG: hypothetical protein HQL10_01360 [Nitrospirae bacterium]|nr:hypothetical protein [Nitrospirota bacterium]
MARKFLETLQILAIELVEQDYNADKTVRKIDAQDIDFITVKDELAEIEVSKFIGEAEIDNINALLAYVLMKDTELGIEEIYAYTFGRGRQIIWN